MSISGVKRSPENLEPEILEPSPVNEPPVDEASHRAARERQIARLRLLWEHRRILVRMTGAGLAAATLAAFLIPARYTSTARLMPPDQQSGLGAALLASLAGRAAGAGAGGSAGGLGTLATEFLGIKNSGDLFIGVLHSRTVQDDLINKFNLRKEYWDRRWEAARKDLDRRTDISQDRKSGIITIKVEDRSRNQAVAMAQEYVAQLNLVVNQLSTSAAHRERVFLEGRLEEVKEDLEEAEKAFSQFASKNTAIDIKEQSKAMVAAAAALQGQLIAAQSELEGLRQIYTENNVRVKTVEARVTELRHELDKLGGADYSQSSSESDGSLYPSIRKLPVLGVPYADLYRRTKVDEAIFEALTQEYELAKVEEAKDIPNVKVLDQPDVPERKSFPPRLLIIILGTMFSFALGGLWVFGNARWAHTDPSDPGKMLAQEVLGVVKTGFPWTSRNGADGANGSESFWRRFAKRKADQQLKQ